MILPDFLDFKTIYLIVHIFGAILGAGGAFMSDIIFFNVIKDGVIDKHELRFMKIGSGLIWFGLLVLIFSGILLFYTDPVFYSASQKFLVKVTIVGVIFINGIIFHKIHFPNLLKNQGIKFSKSESFKKNSIFIIVSGVVSMVSWFSTVVLGMLKKVPYSYIEILSVYLGFVFIGVLFGILLKNKLFPLK